MKNIVKFSLLLTLVAHTTTPIEQGTIPEVQDVMQRAMLKVFDVHYLCAKRLKAQIKDVLDKIRTLHVLDKIRTLQRSNEEPAELEALTASCELLIKELKNAKELSKPLIRAMQSSRLLLQYHKSKGSDIKDTILKYAGELRNAAKSLRSAFRRRANAPDAERAAALQAVAVATVYQLALCSKVDQIKKARLLNEVAKALREAADALKEKASALCSANVLGEEQAAAWEATVTAWQAVATAYQLAADSTADQKIKTYRLSEIARALKEKANALNSAHAQDKERAAAWQSSATAYQMAADSTADQEMKAGLLKEVAEALRSKTVYAQYPRAERSAAWQAVATAWQAVAAAYQMAADSTADQEMKAGLKQGH